MEQSKELKYKFIDLVQAIKSFSDSLDINMSDLNDKMADVVKNGQIQKFEYTFELLWKYLKKYLWEIHGVDAKSPKVTLKESFLMALVSENEYEILMEMLNNRNLIIHVYREDFFKELLGKLPLYAKTMTGIINKIE